MQKYELTLNVNLKGTIFDAKATDDYVFTLGYITGETLRIFQLEDDSQTEQEKLKEQLRIIPEFPKPIYAYEAERQQKWLGCKIEFDLAELWTQIGEQFRRPWTRWCEQCGWVYEWSPSGNCVKCDSQIRDMLREFQPRPTAYVPRGLGPPGKDGGTVWWWKRYLDRREAPDLAMIVLKNQADLLASCCLVVWRSMGLPLTR